MQRRHHDVRWPIVAELDDQIGEIGLVRRDPGRFERPVQPGLVRGHGLDLDHFGLAARADDVDDDPVGLVGIRGPVHMAAGTGAVLLERGQVGIEMGEGVRLDPAPRLAQRLPVVGLADDQRALPANDVGGVPDVAPQLRVAQIPPGRLRKVRCGSRVADPDHRAGSRNKSEPVASAFRRKAAAGVDLPPE